MPKDLYNNRVREFKDYVMMHHNLPVVWTTRFSDGEDMRLWFNQILKSGEFNEFITEIDSILQQFGLKILSDTEKEQEFLNYIANYNQIPLYGQSYFSDNDEMHSWYMSYKQKHNNFETTVHNYLTEYQDFDLAEKWPLIKKEFINIIKQFKRIPNHGEAIIQDGIDVRVIYDKLETFDPEFVEKLLLHLQTYNRNALSKDDRVNELLTSVSNLGYIPFLQESRFSDGTDMFSWYNVYKERIPNLEMEVNAKIKTVPPTRKVNIYLIPNFRNTGGKFYTICTNEGERLDLSEISSFEEAKKLDENLVKRGGVILKGDEEIESVNFAKGKAK